MAIICSICGKKQSGFIADFPLSKDNVRDRICSSCEERKHICERAATVDVDQYQSEKQEFFHNISPDIRPEIQQEIDSWFAEWDAQYQEQYEIKQEEQRAFKLTLQQKTEWEEKINNFMMTSGFNFEGYKITKYVKVISGETALGTGFLSEISVGFADLFGAESITFARKFEKAKDSSTYRLITKAIELNANALIGVKYDFPLVYDNIVAVIASATAVVVEKIEE